MLLSARTSAELTAGVWETLREGLLVPLDASYRFLTESAKSGDDVGEALQSGYRFLHDRVHQAAYELIDPAERGKLHARLGRHLLGQAGSEPADDKLFELVRQLNLGLASLDAGEERLTLARLSLRAGVKVASSGAHGAAVDLLRRCLELLGPGAWADHHDMTHRAHLTLAECEFMSGNLQAALQLLDAVEANARTALERVAGREVRIVILTSVNRLLEAVDCGVETARMLGAEFPRDDAQLGAAIGAELGALQGLLANRSVESLLELPEMADPEKRALVDVFFKTNASAFMSKPQASVLIGLKAARLAIEHGNAPMSPYFYGNYGIINGAVGGDMDVSYRFSRLGIDLVDKAGYTADRRLDALPVRRFQLSLAPAAGAEPGAPPPRGEGLPGDRLLPSRGVGRADRHVLPLLSGREHRRGAGRRAADHGPAAPGGEHGGADVAAGARAEHEGAQPA